MINVPLFNLNIFVWFFITPQPVVLDVKYTIFFFFFQNKSIQVYSNKIVLGFLYIYFYYIAKKYLLKTLIINLNKDINISCECFFFLFGLIYHNLKCTRKQYTLTLKLTFIFVVHISMRKGMLKIEEESFINNRTQGIRLTFHIFVCFYYVFSFPNLEIYIDL